MALFKFQLWLNTKAKILDDAQKVTEVEMHSFIGVMFAMIICPTSAIDDNWMIKRAVFPIHHFFKKITQVSRQSGAWALETLLCLAQIQHQQLTYKEFTLHTVHAVILESINSLQLVGQAAEFKFESKFECPNQQPSSWGCSLALHGLVGLASTSAGCFQVGCSRCWQQLARLRKRCYHSCYTDSVQEQKRF